MAALGKISSVQTLGTLDGPGVRYVLFLYGCPLKCPYCHNPETHVGNEYSLSSAEDVLSRVMRYTGYFGSDGGVTVSGGEPLMQAEFTAELFEKCRQSGINTVLDTSGCLFNDDVKRLLSSTDLVMLDIKMTNERDYLDYIGCELDDVLRFLRYLDENNIDTWLRQVIVEGINDTAQNAAFIGNLQRSYGCVKKVEFLPFKNLCKSKYENMGLCFPLEGTPPTSQSTIKRMYDCMS